MGKMIPKTASKQKRKMHYLNSILEMIGMLLGARIFGRDD
jgi:hypothetical protein